MHRSVLTDKGKSTVVVAARQFLTRLGVKTFVSILGLEPDFIELASLNHIPDIDDTDGKVFFVVEKELLGNKPNNSVKSLLKSFPNSRLMVMSDQEMPNCPCKYYVLEENSHQEILEEFQRFFFEWDEKNESSDEQLLSDREIEVLKEVAYGYANKEIADRLFISINTVITHRKNITEKLGIKTIAGLTVYAVMNKLIDPESVR